MGEDNRTLSFIILFFIILTLAFSLTSAGILKDNMAVGIAAYATKSEGSSGGSGGGGSSGGDKGNDGS